MLKVAGMPRQRKRRWLLCEPAGGLICMFTGENLNWRQTTNRCNVSLGSRRSRRQGLSGGSSDDSAIIIT